MTPEENERLTRVGPGTPVGNLLRRYWWPIWFSEHVKDKPVPVRLLGEDLVLFRDASGACGLLGRHCPHRGASLELGRVEADGLRCCYHGWKFDRAGCCLDMPAEPDDTPLKDEVRHTAYPIQELGGLVFAYLGPAPAPLLPNYDVMVREDCKRVVGVKTDYCNWLQRIENGHDPGHLGILHAAGYPQIALKRNIFTREKTWYGYRTISNFGDDMDKVSHQIFPSHTRRVGARVGDPPRHYIHYRVPVDDTHTATWSVQVEITDTGPHETVCRGWTPTERMVYAREEDGWWGIPSRDQDRIAQESQGEIHDRTRETLGTSDSGIIQYRRLLDEQIKAVEEGRDPLGVIRDPDKNACVSFDATMNFADGVKGAPEMIST
ncbi:MAG: 5,5'-dehydrodivanillate O-demethylase [Alphaproteobacteria bacterium]|jgi:5,5'-dehydrodivanillate O-demethylase